MKKTTLLSSFYKGKRQLSVKAVLSLWVLLLGYGAQLYAQVPPVLTSCEPPTDLVISNVTATAATISWTAPAIPPAQGYQYTVLDSDRKIAASGVTIPEADGVISQKITGLKPATSYMVFIKADCGDGRLSIILNSGPSDLVTPFCDLYTITGKTPATICEASSATLRATASGGTVVWYAASTGGTALGTGTTFITPEISATTSYWVAARKTLEPAVAGPVSPDGGETITERLQTPVLITILKETKLVSVDIYPVNNEKEGTISIKDTSGRLIATHAFTTTVSGGETAQTIVLNEALSPGNYVVVPELPEEGGQVTMGASATYPYRALVADITGNENAAEHYPGLYKWQFERYCSSPRAEVVATVTPAPAAPTGDTTQTINVNTAAEATIGNIKVTGTEIQWYATEADATAGTHPLEATTPLVSEVTYYATQTVAGCRSITPLAVKVTVQLPPAVTLNTDTISLCHGQSGNTVRLEAGGTDYDTYTWLPETGVTGNAADGWVFSPEMTITYTLTASQSEGIYSKTATVAVTVKPVPAAPTGNATQTINVNTAAEATIGNIKVTGTEIQWYATEADATAGIHPLEATTPLVNETTYYATQTVAGCSSTPLAVTVKVTLGTASRTIPGLEYYPNPVTAAFTVTYTDRITSVAVFNQLGQRVMERNPNTTAASLDMSALPTGVYVVQLKANGQLQSVKVVKK